MLESIFSLIIPLAFIGMGVFVLSLNNSWFIKKVNYKNIHGKIISSSTYGGILMTQSSSPQNLKGAYLEYEYEIDGEKFTNNKIYKNADRIAISDEYWADAFLKNYPVGKEVMIMLNPLNVKDTYLIKKSPNTFMFNFVSSLFIVIGVGLLVYRFY